MINKQAGFTLIEILVVVALIGVVVGVTSDVFIQLVKSSNKANIVTEVKQNGDIALKQIERIIRNAQDIEQAGKRVTGSTGTGSYTWFPASTNFSCNGRIPPDGTYNPNNYEYCAIILKNEQGNPATHTKIEFKVENADTGGIIRITNSVGNQSANDLKSTPLSGDLIINNQSQSGVSLSYVNLEIVQNAPNKPALVIVEFDLTQGKQASSRVDGKNTTKFQTILSLRNY